MKKVIFFNFLTLFGVFNILASDLQPGALPDHANDMEIVLFNRDDYRLNQFLDQACLNSNFSSDLNFLADLKDSIKQKLKQENITLKSLVRIFLSLKVSDVDLLKLKILGINLLKAAGKYSLNAQSAFVNALNESSVPAARAVPGTSMVLVRRAPRVTFAVESSTASIQSAPLNDLSVAPIESSTASMQSATLNDLPIELQDKVTTALKDNPLTIGNKNRIIYDYLRACPLTMEEMGTAFRQTKRYRVARIFDTVMNRLIEQQKEDQSLSNKSSDFDSFLTFVDLVSYKLKNRLSIADELQAIIVDYLPQMLEQWSNRSFTLIAWNKCWSEFSKTKTYQAMKSMSNLYDFKDYDSQKEELSNFIEEIRDHLNNQEVEVERLMASNFVTASEKCRLRRDS